MGKLWGAVATWWQGKKTMFGGSLVVAAGVAGVWFGKLDPVTAIGVVGAGLSIAGFAAKANRHQAELLDALQDVASASAQARIGGWPAAAHSLEVAGAGAVSQVAPALIQGSAASLHLSADSASQLAAAVQHLAGNPGVGGASK